ncbi:50S ribosomal protein L15 [Candidatus Parcubacteria bacterium]|nr:MAG: 50S ribosomal protein L15 [Candidatus Parcubacteria bacterium]
MASLHELKRTTLRSKRRVGRGQSSGRGKTSGRGTKGQNARSGRKKRPELRDIIKKIPKRRGFGKNRGRTVVGDRVRPIPVSVTEVAELFDAGTDVTQRSLGERLAITNHKKMVTFKIVGGTVNKKLSIKGVPVSRSVKEALEKLGGTIA